MQDRLDQPGRDGAAFSMFREHAANPFPLFAQMRSMGAVVPLPLPMGGDHRQAWMVTRMEEAVRILKDHAHFTVDPRSLGRDVFFRQNVADLSDTSTFLTSRNSMIAVDEPDH